MQLVDILLKENYSSTGIAQFEFNIKELVNSDIWNEENGDELDPELVDVPYTLEAKYEGTNVPSGDRDIPDSRNEYFEVIKDGEYVDLIKAIDTIEKSGKPGIANECREYLAEIDNRPEDYFEI